MSGLLASSCGVNGADDFNVQALDLACDIQNKCGEDVTMGADLNLLPDPEDPVDEGPCSTRRANDFNACASNCGFHARSARKCLRRLERALDDCEPVNLSPCRRVYRDCDPEFERVHRCDLWSCSVGDHPSPAGALLPLGLLVLGIGTRRRRRRS